ncbi:MAG: trehalose-phosphatase [Anaerolineales bacterium]|nr:trehalose-phosphatase [Anaerolineales bacterium]
MKQAREVWLLLDYDGTLADFAPTPDTILPDPGLVALIKNFTTLPAVQLGIISGRRLAHIETLVPLDGIWRAGSYGLEMTSPKGEHIEQIEFSAVRPSLEQLKPRWERLLAGQEGFYLEDKGWSLALHARFVEDRLAESILNQAASLASETLSTGKPFKLLGGYKFLEIAPAGADKGQTVQYLLNNYALPPYFTIYLGDDDKDEKAFPVVHTHGGLTGLVSKQDRQTAADFRLETPAQTRQWLKDLYSFLQG